jgi:hypothetical protein
LLLLRPPVLRREGGRGEGGREGQREGDREANRDKGPCLIGLIFGLRFRV